MQKKDKPLFISSLVSIFSNIACITISFYTALIMWLALDISSSASGDNPKGLFLFLVILLSVLCIVSITNVVFALTIIIKQKRSSLLNIKTFITCFIICLIISVLLLIITMCFFLEFKYLLIYGTFTMINIITIIFSISSLKNKEQKLDNNTNNGIDKDNDISLEENNNN